MDLKYILVFWGGVPTVVLRKLTARQLDFLRHIFEHYQTDQGPIHYTSVAKWLGVSKWTAYDMLKRLGRAGYLASSYDVSRGSAGRSQIFYTPTNKLHQLLQKEDPGPDEWQSWCRRLFLYLKRLEGGEGNDVIGELTALLPEARTPLMHCACLLALFIAYLKVFHAEGIGLIRQITALIKKPEQRLSVFSGTVLGALSGDCSPDLMTKKKGGLMAESVDKFQRNLADVNLKQHRLLVGLLDDLLQCVA